jgi:hypothetical protein
MAVLSQVLLDEPPPPSKFRPDLDAELEAICQKAMAKKIEGRYGSMAEFAAALQSYLRSTGQAPAPASPSDTVTLPDEEVPAAAAVGRRPRPSPRLAKGGRRRPRGRVGRPLWLWGIGAATTLTLLVCVCLPLLLKNAVPQNTYDPAAVAEKEATAARGGFEPLFNGTDLFADWEVASGDPAVWRAEGGVMGFTLTDTPRQHGWLLTRRDYTDFLLRFEFQLAPGANSGVAVRTWPGCPKPLEIQIQDDTFPEYAAQGPLERTGALFRLAGRPAKLRPLGSWNRMEVELRGWSLRVAVNGEETLHLLLNEDRVFRYLDGAPPASGRIGLQHWRGSVRFRELEVIDLSAPQADPARRDNP